MLNNNYAKQHSQNTDEKVKESRLLCINPGLTSELQVRWDTVWGKLSGEEVKFPIESYYCDFFSSVNATKHVCIFGCGHEGRAVLYELKRRKIHVSFMCDNSPDKCGKEIFGVKCISPDELKQIAKDVTVAVATRYFADIVTQLKNIGIANIFVCEAMTLSQNEKFSCEYLSGKKESIAGLLPVWADEESLLVFIKRLEALVLAKVEDYLEERFWKEISRPAKLAYFDGDIVELTKNESFVDAGAYDGDTLLEFVKHTDGVFAKAYEFELDESNISRLRDTIDELPQDVNRRVELIPKGLYDREDEFEIFLSEEETSVENRVHSNGSIPSTATVIPLDIAIDAPVSFIKMDIEGAELAALKGSAGTIKKCRPTLAICVYHKVEDIWEIPEYILSLAPDYKFYLRHYNPLGTETVCYAIPFESLKD